MPHYKLRDSEAENSRTSRSGITVTATLQSQVLSARGRTSVVHQLEVNTGAGWSARGHSLPNRTRSKSNRRGSSRSVPASHLKSRAAFCQLETAETSVSSHKRTSPAPIKVWLHVLSLSCFSSSLSARGRTGYTCSGLCKLDA